RMEAKWRHGRAHCRCRHTDDPATENGRRSIYVREDTVLRHLDDWLGRVFDPGNVEATLDALTLAASEGDNEDARGREEATGRLHARLGDCDTRLDRYRAALDTGADPAVVTAWIAEVQTERDAIQRDLAGAGDPIARREVVTRDELEGLIAPLGDVRQALFDTGAPEEKANVYAGLGVTLDYDPDARTVVVECEIDGSWSNGSCRRGDPDPSSTDGDAWSKGRCRRGDLNSCRWRNAACRVGNQSPLIARSARSTTPRAGRGRTTAWTPQPASPNWRRRTRRCGPGWGN
ncbi:MAG: hypothetical protein ACRD0D_12470, partial [Acidimicrobiales bacterium]